MHTYTCSHTRAHIRSHMRTRTHTRMRTHAHALTVMPVFKACALDALDVHAAPCVHLLVHVAHLPTDVRPLLADVYCTCAHCTSRFEMCTDRCAPCTAHVRIVPADLSCVPADAHCGLQNVSNEVADARHVPADAHCGLQNVHNVLTGVHFGLKHNAHLPASACKQDPFAQCQYEPHRCAHACTGKPANQYLAQQPPQTYSFRPRACKDGWMPLSPHGNNLHSEIVLALGDVVGGGHAIMHGLTNPNPCLTYLCFYANLSICACMRACVRSSSSSSSSSKEGEGSPLPCPLQATPRLRGQRRCRWEIGHVKRMYG